MSTIPAVCSHDYNLCLGLVPLLASHLRKFRSTQRAWLCSEEAVHIAIEPWDRGWGCGFVFIYSEHAVKVMLNLLYRYRNFLMACSALMTQTQQPMYFPLLDDPSPPGVRNLQKWIEDAWKQGWFTYNIPAWNVFNWPILGFDKAGARDLKNKLHETNKWIGTAGTSIRTLTWPLVLTPFIWSPIRYMGSLHFT